MIEIQTLQQIEAHTTHLGLDDRVEVILLDIGIDQGRHILINKPRVVTCRPAKQLDRRSQILPRRRIMPVGFGQAHGQYLILEIFDRRS